MLGVVSMPMRKKIMAKNNNYDKELELIDKLKYENKKLKRALKASRKMLDRYNVAEEKGLIDEDIIVPGKKRQKEKELKEQWKCHDCENGYLYIIHIGNRYFRKCNGCSKNTRSQIWNDTIKGLK